MEGRFGYVAAVTISGRRLGNHTADHQAASDELP
jgi:hypothetical protein